MTTKDIDSVLHEERLFQPPARFTATAVLNTRDKLEALHRHATSNHEEFWATLARSEIDWQKPFQKVLDTSNAPHFRWFEDGSLNVSYNCLDRHLSANGDKNAIVFEGEQGDTRQLTYSELHREVCKFANALLRLGIKTGDRIIIYMPMVPEAVIAMQACARIGAIHSVVFGGFSAESLKDRIMDAGARMVITADGAHRAGKIIELKKAVDHALESDKTPVEKVIVLKRSNHEIPFNSNRDIWWEDTIDGVNDGCDPVWVNAEHPLFLLYTSGSTGKPKGIQHSSGGYLLGAIMTLKWVFDYQDNDIFWCTADVGWITGHSYVAYGPLAVGSTMLMYEGAPTVPDAGRFWSICERHKVTIFYTAPTAIRALMKCGDTTSMPRD